MTLDSAIKIVEDVPGEGTIVQAGELVSFDLQITLNRGDVIYPRQGTTIRVGDRHVFPGLSKSVEGMRRGGYRKTRVAPHLAYGAEGVVGKIPPEAVLICELWVANSRSSAVPVT